MGGSKIVFDYTKYNYGDHYDINISEYQGPPWYSEMLMS